MKLLNIVICTKDKPDFLSELLNSIFFIPSWKENLDIFIINDGSIKNYDKVLDLIKNFNNIHYYVNQKNIGKINSLFKYKDFFDGKYVMTFDDKDVLINQKLFTSIFSTLKTKNEIMIAYYENTYHEKIGADIKDGETYAQYYFKRGQSGDHLFLIPNSLFQTFTLPETLDCLVINDELVYLQYIFNLPSYNFNFLKPIAIHDYKRGNLTKNIFQNKIRNWQVTRYCAFLVLDQKPCLKIKIIKLFELFLTRTNGRLKINKKKDSYLYSLLKFSGAFIFIKKIYLHEVKKLLE